MWRLIEWISPCSYLVISWQLVDITRQVFNQHVRLSPKKIDTHKMQWEDKMCCYICCRQTPKKRNQNKDINNKKYVKVWRPGGWKYWKHMMSWTGGNQKWLSYYRKLVFQTLTRLQTSKHIWFPRYLLVSPWIKAQLKCSSQFKS